MAEPTAPATVDDVDAMLLEFLELYRSVAVRKVEGLTTEQATAVATPTGMTLLGLVKHLAWAPADLVRLPLPRESVEPMEADRLLPHRAHRHHRNLVLAGFSGDVAWSR